MLGGSMQMYQCISMCSLPTMSLFTASRRHCALRSLFMTNWRRCSLASWQPAHFNMTSLFTARWRHCSLPDDVIELAPAAELMSVDICPDSDRHKLKCHRSNCPSTCSAHLHSLSRRHLSHAGCDWKRLIYGSMYTEDVLQNHLTHA